MKSVVTCLSLFAASSLSAATLNVVTDFGADPTGSKPAHQEIRKAIAKAAPGDVVFFPKGRYFIEKSLWVGIKRQITLRGEPGTVICMHCNPCGEENESSGSFHLYQCEDIAIENFTLTTDNPIGCVGTVVGTDLTNRTLDLRIAEGFPATGKEHFFQLNTYDSDGSPDGALETHVAIHPRKLADGTTVYEGMPYQMIAPRVARITLPKWASPAAVTNGHNLLVRYFRNGGSALNFQQAKRVRVENFEVERTPSTGCVISPPSEDITFRRFCIRPRAGDPNVCASNADGIHFGACGGKIVLEDCHFVGLGDDALNVHCMGTEVKSYDPATGKIQFFAHTGAERKPSLIVPNWTQPGNTIEFYDPKTLRLKGSAKIKSFVDDRSGQGELEKGGFEPQIGDYAANGNYFPSVRISKCSVRNTRARAFLLQTRDVVVSDCDFFGLRSAALLFACDMAFWNEMGPVANVEVRNCRFEKCARAWPTRDYHYYGAIGVKGRHDDGPCDMPAGVHRDIRIFDNQFTNIGSNPIYVQVTDGLQVRGNRYVNCGNDPHATPEIKAAPVRLHHCANVYIDNNRY